MFNWGGEEEKVPGSVPAALRCVRGLRRGRSQARETEPVQPVSEARIKAVLPFVSRQVGAMIQLQWLTGMRPGEVVQMRWMDIDRTGQIWIYRPASHKTEHHSRERLISLGPKAQAILQGFKKLSPQTPIFSPIEADVEIRAKRRIERKTKIQPSQIARHEKAMRSPKHRLNEAYSSVTYRRAVVRACKAAGIPPWSPNQLRHAAATRIRKQYGLDAARALLGHSSPATTEVYAELDRVQASKIMAECG